MESSAYGLLIFLPAILIPACASSSLTFHLIYNLNKQGDNIQHCCYSFPNVEPVHCSMSGSDCCFLTCIQVLQEAVKVVWYKNFPPFVVIHTVKGFHLVSEAEVDVFLEFSCFSYDPMGCWQFDLWFLGLF